MVSPRLAVLGVLLAIVAVGCVALPRYMPVRSVVYLDQNWSDEDRRWFYHASQGTRLMPYAWFLALEQPRLSLAGARPFAAPEYLARFGFIPDPVSPENPDGLPVGFAAGESAVEGTTKPEAVVGLSCAACHTGQIEFEGRGIRIDGGPAMTNTSAFQSQIGLALVLTYESDVRFTRFAERVLGADNTPAARAVLRERLGKALSAGRAEAGMASKEQLYPVEEGFGRLDALGRGANFVFGTLLEDKRNFAPADAPVSYPALWDAPWFDWVQYNGAIRQPMGRNVAEAMGVRSVVKMTGKPEDQYRSTVHIRNIAAMEHLLAGPSPEAGLRSPRWPEQVLGALDMAKAERGRAHYQRLCTGCHDGAWSQADEHGRSYREIKMLPVAAIGTDPKSATNFVARRAYLTATDTVPISAAEGLKAVTDGVIQFWYNANQIPPAERLSMDGYRANEWRSVSGYRARPLNGIWATAPYLHNGSVPNLYEMLLPSERRSSQFHTGGRKFDPEKVGFDTTPFDGSFAFDTSIPGNGNKGHEFRSGPTGSGVIGPELNDVERREIIEYLKTL
jgi:cytochrome c5